MNEVILDVYIAISILIAITDVYLGVQSLKKNRTTGRFLGIACIAAAIVDISYLVSILSETYILMSVMSSIYFISIDFMLISLLIFVVYFIKGKFSKTGKTAIRICWLYALYELVIFVINPFCEIAIGYTGRDTFIAKYNYDMKPLYCIHLVFSYLIVVAVLFLLIRKMCRIPKEYRGSVPLCDSGNLYDRTCKCNLPVPAGRQCI